MLTTRRTVVLLGVILLGCTAGPDRGIAGPEPHFAKSSVQQQVTGHANVQLPFAGNAEEKYSNSAIRHADGSVTGQFQLKTEQEEGGSFHGSVLCFTIDATGRTARLGGIIEKSTTPLAPEGTYVIWTVVDNGEGNNDPPDATSDLYGATAGQVAFHCAVGFNLAPFLPVLGGNLQVHP